MTRPAELRKAFLTVYKHFGASPKEATPPKSKVLGETDFDAGQPAAALQAEITAAYALAKRRYDAAEQAKDMVEVNRLTPILQKLLLWIAYAQRQLVADLDADKTSELKDGVERITGKLRKAEAEFGKVGGALEQVDGILGQLATLIGNLNQ